MTVDWFVVKFSDLTDQDEPVQDVFPGCTPCCDLVGSPQAHRALDAVPLEDLNILPIFREAVEAFHTNGHRYDTFPTPADVAKRTKELTAQ